MAAVDDVLVVAVAIVVVVVVGEKDAEAVDAGRTGGGIAEAGAGAGGDDEVMIGDEGSSKDVDVEGVDRRWYSKWCRPANAFAFLDMTSL